MSEMKHTPGPWECDGDFFDVCRVEFEGSGSYTTIGSKNRIGGPVAFAVGTPDTYWRDDEEQSANARLIAAAPELLQAVIDFLPMVKDLEDCGPPNEGWQSDELMKAIEKARQAVSKATGAAQ